MILPAELAALPVAGVIDELRRVLAGATTAIVVAPPGAGKTTTVPLALLDEPWAAGGRIIMLEPRRLATRAAAQRMAALLGEPVGATVGYQTRDERRIGPTTRIEVVTEGVLTRRLQHDPTLGGTAAVIFDEVHERNLATDIGLALALDARDVVRPDLRILAMSATLDAAALRRALGDVPVVTSDGRRHPVDVRWLPMARTDRLEPAVAAAVRRALADEPGDVLVFLPGIGEISRVQSALADLAGAGMDVLPLAGALSLAEHDAALTPSPPGRRRVVLSTDIAESSLTVAGVRVVVDAGLARVPRLDVRTGMTRLTTVATSRASADQRAGRAGRTEPGVCYRLWSKLEHGTRLSHLPAEITQVDLAGLALEVAVWGTPVERLRFIDPPPAGALRRATEVLTLVGALDRDGRITDTGRRMVNLPVHPRLARLVDAAGRADRSLACVLAAILDDRDVFRGRPFDLPADIALRVAAVTGQAGHDALDRARARRALDRAADLARRSGARFEPGDADPHHCGRVLLAGFPDRLAVRRSQPGSFQLRSGAGALTSADDPLAGEAFIVAADVDGDRKQARVRMGAAVDPADIVDVLAEHVEVRDDVVWDRERGDVVERIEWRLGGMLLQQQVRAAPVGPATTAALLDRVRVTRMAVLAGDGAAALRARVGFVRQAVGEEWPDWGDRQLLATLDVWLAPYVDGLTSVSELTRLDVGMVLMAGLSWDQTQQLADLAPVTLGTPSGRHAPIDYTRAAPTASVRVQDLFGLTLHPTVAGGRVPITLELLSPADRPIQITSDLAGFWRGSWAEVRKEMVGRYPKHHWPTDPTVAPPRRLR